MHVLAPDVPTLLRRLLLALVTALIVARPLVLGEDPGLSANLADPWSLVLTLLWLLAAVGWAAWRFWLRPTSSRYNSQGAERDGLKPEHWYGSLVQSSLLLTVALVFVSAELAADYQFPARLIAWEWFGLFVSFLVVQQLAVTPQEQHGLFTVVLAGAVALAAQGIYQYGVEFPRNRQLAEDAEAFRANWAEENPGQDISEGLLQQLRLRAKENNIFGPYAHPNSYAGFLVLWLPGLVGAALISSRVQAPRWHKMLTIGCALLGLSALWLTHSRGAFLGLTAASIGVGLLLYRHRLRQHTLAVLIGITALTILTYSGWRSGLLTVSVGKSNNPIAQRLEYWRTSWQMIRERPWLGVGPGNFGENYPRLMPANAEEKIKDPHHFALEMWATCGVFALLALLGSLAAFFYQTARGVVSTPASGLASPLASGVVPALRGSSPGGATQPPSAEPTVRWEFYVGGMVGLVLGFVLRVNTATPSSILGETYAAAVRSVVWFAAFALLERLVWTDRGRTLALMAGIVALLLNLCVSGGIGFPSVAGPLWVAVALALNAAKLQPVPWLSRAGAAIILPLPIFLGLFLSYGIYVLYPVLASDSLVREAVQAVAYFQKERSKPFSERSAGIRDYPERFLQKGVIDRLQQAAQLTPDDARIYVQLAWWTNAVWELKRQKSLQNLPLAKSALDFGLKATQLDPRGAAGYWVLYQIRIRYAKINEEDAETLRKLHGDPVVINDREYTAREQYKQAAQTLERYLPHDPHDTELHYALWYAWSKAGDKEIAREHAEKALAIDDLVHMPIRKLTDLHRKQIEDWIKALKQEKSQGAS